MRARQLLAKEKGRTGNTPLDERAENGRKVELDLVARITFQRAFQVDQVLHARSVDVGAGRHVEDDGAEDGLVLRGLFFGSRGGLALSPGKRAGVVPWSVTSPDVVELVARPGVLVRVLDDHVGICKGRASASIYPLRTRLAHTVSSVRVQE